MATVGSSHIAYRMQVLAQNIRHSIGSISSLCSVHHLYRDHQSLMYLPQIFLPSSVPTTQHSARLSSIPVVGVIALPVGGMLPNSLPLLMHCDNDITLKSSLSAAQMMVAMRSKLP